MSNLVYENTPYFDRCFKRLLKRFRSLEQDFALVKEATIELYYGRQERIDNSSVLQIPGLCNEHIHICKLKKFACKSLRGGAASGLRAIFAFVPSQNRVVFIELYYKGDQENEDRKLINAVRTDLLKELGV